MKINAKIKSSKFKKKIFEDLKKLSCKIKAGYPKENSSSSELDKNGFSALEKAYDINFANKNHIPYLLISFENNKLKNQKRFKQIVKMKPASQPKELDKLGEEMVKDIQKTLLSIQVSPASNNQGCIYGAVSHFRVKK